MEQRNRPDNLKRGYDLVAQALRHLAYKISSPTNDENQKVINQLIRQKLDITAEDILLKAKRMDEFYQKSLAPGPWNQDPYIFSSLSDDEQEEVSSMRNLICFALAVYGDDLSQTKKRLPIGSRARNYPDEDTEDLESIDLQLEIIEDVMREDYNCG
jgi:hypothetical protein